MKRLLLILFSVSGSLVLTIYIFQLQHLILSNTLMQNKFDYYLCTQVMDEEQFLPEWLDYNMNILGFKNICIINVGKNISVNITSKYDVAYTSHHNSTKQDFNLCKKCFTSIKSQDLLLIQDIDQFLNVRDSTYLTKNYDRYDGFYFHDMRFGYVKDKTNEIFNNKQSRFPMLTTNTYRGLIKTLDGSNGNQSDQSFNCSVRGGWNSWPHFHQTTKNKSKILHVDMKQMRLNHYYVRSKEDGILKGKKWNKLQSMLGIIESNNFFKMTYDDTILTSKTLK
ncbi:unnamed protein product [Didymodactylos carnosus]|uniref:Uncharacterized protein n=1 Tax=Didymodactylos carnosus TaxID=1234261 RepID=A0A815DBM2_9BILA|nr:unnamed protein product [Didymodactylos carnosus]CAF1295780.1 unnamed protein product [Didymodactylos carnosus]CAF3815487.1 unnamed protein product [Didymodactylos carnosus]CAF4110094.1 unnamed protein product [Didymodactylos carnosus]